MSIKDVLAIPHYAYGDNQAACEAFRELRRAANTIERLAAFVGELAGEDCEYGEGSPDACKASRKHYQCLPCKAKSVLASAR